MCFQQWQKWQNMYVCAEEAYFEQIHLPYLLNTVCCFSQSHDNFFMKTYMVEWQGSSAMT
jgi:hypothetical protein